MGTNLTKTNCDYAIYLPSISAFYSKFASGYNGKVLKESEPRKGIHPPGIEHGLDSFDFLNEEKGMFFYKDALYSAGHAFLNLENSLKDESMIQQRDRKNTWIMGDSGGFQIAKGLLKFDWKDFEGNTSNNMRQKILEWLEFTADYSMILDIPPWAIGTCDGIDSFDACLKGTMINNDYFIKNRMGITKFLNVLQGRSQTESDIWFNEVKDLPFEGWAFGGDNMSDFEMILNRVIMMRDGNYFGKNENGDVRNILHFLGQSKPKIACALTSIQRLLRKQLNDKELKVTYDSASAFISSAKGRIYTGMAFNSKKASYTMDKMFDDKSLAGSKLPFPWDGIVGDRLTIGDICIRDEKFIEANGKPVKTSWDSYSYALIMAHNVEYHIKAIQKANRLYDLPFSQNKYYLPGDLLEFKDVVQEVFASETPFKIIQQHHKLLNSVSGRKKGKGVNIIESSNLFEMDTGGANLISEVDYENLEDADITKLEAELNPSLEGENSIQRTG